jgi:cytoskeletal protein CcmA (bactofilin family)
MNNQVIAGTLDISNLVMTGTQMTVQAPLQLSNLTATGTVIITDPTPGNSSSGALFLSNGGIGVAGASYFGGNLTIQGTTTINGDLNASSAIINGTLSATTLQIDQINANTVVGNTVSSVNFNNLLANSSDANTWFGENAMNTYSSGSAEDATNNTAFGYESLSDLSFGSGNIAMGYQALQSLVNGTNNTAVGSQALYSQTNAESNTAIGSQALYTLNDPDASNNVAVGIQSLYSATTGFQNTCVGAFSGYLYNPSNLTGNMTSLGFKAGYNDISGENNTFLGAFADISAGQIYTNSTALGYGAQITDNHQIMLGTDLDYIQVPGNMKVSGSMDISGDLSVHPGNIYGTVLPYSDARLKEEATPLPPVLASLSLLGPKRFRWKESQKEDVGFIAQEFYEIMGPDLWPTDSIHTAHNGFLTLDYAKMVVFLTKAVQELHQKIDGLKEEIQQKSRARVIDE